MNDRDLFGKAATWIATGLGVGLVAPAPGTIGGLWGLPLAWMVVSLDPAGQWGVNVALLTVSVWLCTVAAASLGGSKDPQAIVLDEIVVLPVVFSGVTNFTPAVWIAGFLLFRFFDITKLWPAKLAEQLPSGLGIVADDFVAALYAMLALNGLVWLDTSAQLGWLLPTS